MILKKIIKKSELLIHMKQSNREDKFDKYEKEKENEKEIKENCEIRINNKIIPFSYIYKFNKKGKYNVKYIFKENITN